MSVQGILLSSKRLLSLGDVNNTEVMIQCQMIALRLPVCLTNRELVQTQPNESEVRVTEGGQLHSKVGSGHHGKGSTGVYWWWSIAFGKLALFDNNKTPKVNQQQQERKQSVSGSKDQLGSR